MLGLAVDTLAVYDPEPVAMEGLRCLMESIDGPRVVAVENNMEGAVTAVRQLQPSLLIVDKGLGVPTLTDWMRLLNAAEKPTAVIDRKSTRLNSSHLGISYAVFCLKKK